MSRDKDENRAVEYNTAMRRRLIERIGEWFDRVSETDRWEEGVPVGSLKIEMHKEGSYAELVTIGIEETIGFRTI